MIPSMQAGGGHARHGCGRDRDQAAGDDGVKVGEGEGVSVEEDGLHGAFSLKNALKFKKKSRDKQLVFQPERDKKKAAPVGRRLVVGRCVRQAYIMPSLRNWS